jgi:hypothetical protein
MKSKYKNRVCFIQSEVVFEYDKNEDGVSTVIDYLKIKKSQFLESKDECKIFDFIYNHAKNNNIRRFVCHIGSDVLENLIDKMVKEKSNSSRVRSLLKKCTFIATYSNANATREKNKATGSMFLFSLSDLQTILNSLPNDKSSVVIPGTTGSDARQTKPKEILVCVSDSAYSTRLTPANSFFEQVNNNYFDNEKTIIQKVKASGLTKEILNTFVDQGGYNVTVALDTLAEYEKFTETMLASTFKKQIVFIENTQPLATRELSTTQVVSSGLCINAPRSAYPYLSPVLSYEICAAILTVCWRSWCRFKKSGVLSLN